MLRRLFAGAPNLNETEMTKGTTHSQLVGSDSNIFLHFAAVCEIEAVFTKLIASITVERAS